MFTRKRGSKERHKAEIGNVGFVTHAEGVYLTQVTRLCGGETGEGQHQEISPTQASKSKKARLNPKKNSSPGNTKKGWK